MKNLAAYLLLQAGGKAEPTAEDIKQVLGAVGIEPDDERISQVISELSGKQVSDLIAQGSEKLASVPTGGVAAPSGASAAAGGASAAAEETKEEAKEESESDGDMGMSLFD